MIKNMLSSTSISGPVVIKYFVIQLLTVVLLFISSGKSLQTFFAVFIGISITTLTIMINAVTEAIGITKNNFE